MNTYTRKCSKTTTKCEKLKVSTMLANGSHTLWSILQPPAASELPYNSKHNLFFLFLGVSSTLFGSTVGWLVNP